MAAVVYIAENPYLAQGVFYCNLLGLMTEAEKGCSRDFGVDDGYFTHHLMACISSLMIHRLTHYTQEACIVIK